MNILHEEGLHKFIAKDGNATAGFIDYEETGTDAITVSHTEVDPAYGGQGIGKTILLEVIDYARKNDLKIIPTCSYAQRVFEKNEELQDVLS